MSCPTCDHTLQAVTNVPAVGGRPVFWCPRCGTLCHGNDCEAPKLVDRCREFEKILVGAKAMTDKQPWRTLGIAESIHKPEDRPLCS